VIVGTADWRGSVGLAVESRRSPRTLWPAWNAEASQPPLQASPEMRSHLPPRNKFKRPKPMQVPFSLTI
jgi:hypothetical protein